VFRPYLIPGRHEPVDGALGQLIREWVGPVTGRGLDGAFARLRFGDQLARIADDLTGRHWSAETLLVGRSYGGYLLLHALADLTPFPGRVLLLSPVLGPAVSPTGRAGSRPPRADRLPRLVREGRFPPPGALVVYTGGADTGCDPELARQIILGIPGARLRIIPEADHDLPADCIRAAVSEILEGAVP
jgi:pimeloyl-ACP methyl ester carboxylesterase